MKKLYLLLIIAPIWGFGQGVYLNGMTINAPEGFVRSDAMGENVILWIKFNEYDNASDYITFFNIEENTDLSLAEKNCKKGTRTTEFIKFTNIKINNVSFPICFQRGDNDLLISFFYYKKNGFTYVVYCNTYDGTDEKFKSSEFNNPYENIEYMVGYMAAKLLVQ